jgi:hypothetical protein
MKRQTISGFVAASLAILVLGACTDPTMPTRTLPGSPVEILIPHDGYPFPSTPTADGLVLLCKVSNVVGTFDFNVTTPSGGSTVSITIGAAEVNTLKCHTAALYNSDAAATVGETVTIVETNPGAGFSVDIDIDQYYVSSANYGAVNPLGDTFNNATRTATVVINDDLEKRVTFRNTFTPPAGALFIILDEDAIDNDLRFDPTPSGPYSPHSNVVGQDITSNTQTKFTKANVNDDIPGKTQRAPLRYFSGPPLGPPFGTEITILSGSTGDEGWFAPTIAPTKWCTTAQINGGTCTTQQAIANFVGSGTGVPAQDKLDKIPEVVPLRALGLHLLEGRLLCAVVYDSDIGINYDEGKTPFLTANLQGETLGIAAFTVVVNGVNRLQGFSSSTLPEVRIRIEDPAVCSAPLSLFAAPVPRTSSIPNDINPHNTPGVSSNGYKSIP